MTDGNACVIWEAASTSHWESLVQWAKGWIVVLNLRHKVLKISVLLHYSSHDASLHPGWLGCVCWIESRLSKNNVLMFLGSKICYVAVVSHLKFLLFVLFEFVFFHVVGIIFKLSTCQPLGKHKPTNVNGGWGMESNKSLNVVRFIWTCVCVYLVLLL